jgi:orotate phosphoribosyltransferase
LTAGTAIKNSLEVLKNQNASLAGVIVALDREEKNESGITYKNLLEINGIKIFSIANISDLNI